MAAYKKQHFLPCCYLKFFSIDGTWKDARNTSVYFTDGNRSSRTAVKNLGVERYAYSKQNPEFDRQFHEMENDYPNTVELFLTGRNTLGKSQYFGFVMMMIDFNLRSVAYENRSEVERMHTYQAISRSFNHKMFCEAPGQGTDMPEMLFWMEKNWRIALITPESDEKFITSDNPSTIFTEPKLSVPVMVYLPIHPDLAVIAHDRRHIEVPSNRTSDDALGILNGLQINRSVRHTFANHDLREDPDAWGKIQGLVKKEKPERWVDGREWRPDFLSIASPVLERFDFLVRK